MVPPAFCSPSSCFQLALPLKNSASAETTFGNIFPDPSPLTPEHISIKAFIILWRYLSIQTGPQNSSRTGVIPYWSLVKVKVSQSCQFLVTPWTTQSMGILQVRILEWVAIPFSRGSYQPRDRTQVSLVAGGYFTSCLYIKIYSIVRHIVSFIVCLRDAWKWIV